MAEFQIKSKDGLVTRATGAPVYNGTYLKPGYLEFAEIASPTPIDWQAGDYVDYPRTGLRYRLYNTPKSRKQGEQNLYGASFVYENVQFFDITKELELAPFADFVPDDNLIHFSTLNSVAFFGTPANVAERVQACLNYWFPSSNWIVRVITGLDPSTDAELIETLSTDAEFSVSGTSCQGALDRLYDTWNGLGYSFSQSGGSNIITIGYPNKRTVANTTSSYGRIDDNGIVTLARSVSNIDEIGTRLYAYGSMRNMPTGYYREKDIKDAESVDIEHLMLPINAVPSLNYGGWGETDNLPDARKAYIENSAAISQLGLIPRYAYFDGSDSNYPEICPSIVGATIGDVIDGKQATGDTDYVPSLSKWSRDDRIDEIVSATNPSDAGGGSNSGSKYSESGDHSTAAGTIDSSEGETEWELGSYSPSAPSGSAYIVLNVDGEIEIATEDIDKIEVVAKLIAGPGVSGTSIYDIPVEMDMGSESDVHAFTLSNVSANIVSKGITYVRINFVIQREGQEPVDYLATINAGTVFIGFTPYITKTFSVSIPQIGFNLLQYADMGNGKTISMKTGMCAGRDFPITAASYVSSSDTWSLTLSRVKDSDTGLLYPNSDFPIAEGDKYVLLDIAMPELYISMASIRLLKAAQKLLGDIDHEKPFYEPEIDSKRVYNESRVLREGMWMHLVGDEIVDGGEDYSIIDTLQIDEGVSNIPVYSVTLREKKPVEWTESISQSSRTVTSSAVDESATPAQSSGSANLDWFIQESYDDSGSTKYRLKLNPKYQGMYAEGWVSAGGIGTGGGGTIVASLPDLTDVNDNLYTGLQTGQALVWDGTKWTGGTVSGNVDPATVSTYGTVKVAAVESGTASNVKTGVYGNRHGVKMDASGKTYVDINVQASTSLFGGFILSAAQRNVPASSFVIGGGTSDRYYGVEMNLAGQLFVNVPWESAPASSVSSVAGYTGDVTAAQLSTALGLSGYLPLTAGSTKPLTGTLYVNPSSSSDPAIRITVTGDSSTHGINYVDSSGNLKARFGVNGSSGLFQIFANGNVTLRTGGTSASGFTISSPSTSSSNVTSYMMYPAIAGVINLNSSGAFTSLGNGADFASPGTPMRSISTKIIYLASGAYIYYDTVNGCIRTNAPIVSDSYISAGGVSTT